MAVRKVVAGMTHDGLRVITKGLDPGASVIVDGLQMIRPGLPVKTEPAELARREIDGTKVTVADSVDSAQVVRLGCDAIRRDDEPTPIFIRELDSHGRFLHPPADFRHGLGVS